MSAQPQLKAAFANCMLHIYLVIMALTVWKARADSPSVSNVRASQRAQTNLVTTSRSLEIGRIGYGCSCHNAALSGGRAGLHRGGATSGHRGSRGSFVKQALVTSASDAAPFEASQVHAHHRTT
jgi:hypothetical protein